MLSRCTSEATYHHEQLIDVTWGQGLMDEISYMRGTFSEQVKNILKKFRNDGMKKNENWQKNIQDK